MFSQSGDCLPVLASGASVVGLRPPRNDMVKNMPVVKLYANLRKLAGTKEVSISESTVGAVLNELVKQYPSLDGVVLENGELRPHVVITLNGHNTSDMNIQVAEQDEIAIFPPIAGG
jgi:sulfur-carrier protein